MLRRGKVRKSRITLSIHPDGIEMLAEIAERMRISASDVVELWITDGYEALFGKGTRPVKPELTRMRK